MCGLCTIQNRRTAELLKRIFNGTGTSRSEREKSFYDYFLSQISDFQRILIEWLFKGTEESRKAIEQQLSEESEFLGIKYWLIRQIPAAHQSLSPLPQWNRPGSQTPDTK